MDQDHLFLHQAMRLARQAGQAGNLPIGAVITLDGEIVAQGQNAIWAPALSPGRHAEMEALAALPRDVLPHTKEMTLYTTLEPCLMCTGTILVFRIGRVLFGSYDERGGATSVFGHMPPAFERLKQDVEWIGPALLQECDELSAEVMRLLDAYRAQTEG